MLNFEVSFSNPSSYNFFIAIFTFKCRKLKNTRLYLSICVSMRVLRIASRSGIMEFSVLRSQRKFPVKVPKWLRFALMESCRFSKTRWTKVRVTDSIFLQAFNFKLEDGMNLGKEDKYFLEISNMYSELTLVDTICKLFFNYMNMRKFYYFLDQMDIRLYTSIWRNRTSFGFS